ncbi:MAG: hypothetical protein FWH43_05850 [Endomicrobia bacterium]|nr:hypothetical protein [Endomicrobiia bacterium]
MISSEQNNYLPYASKEISVDVIYIARGIDYGIKQAEIFFESYNKHNAGIKHNLIIASKAWDGKDDEYKQLQALAALNNAKIIDLPDDGLDFTAYYRAAENSNADYVFCLATACIILKEHWLLAFINTARDNPDFKLLGSSGSWETSLTVYAYIKYVVSQYLKKFSNKHKPEQQLKEKRTRSFKEKLYGHFINFRYIILRNINPIPFPNYHIRSSGFFVDKLLYIDYIKQTGFPKDKFDTYDMESGNKSMTKFVFNRGFNAGVVGADKKLYTKEFWDKSRTFRTPDASNMLINDKQSIIYQNSDNKTKRFLEKAAWGRQLS